MKETILCAAIYYNDQVHREHLPKNLYTGMCFSGWRHANCLAQMAAFYYPDFQTNRKHNVIRVGVLAEHEQGFLTSKGRFVGRQDALAIAKEAGQTVIGDVTDRLCSENLY